MRSGLWGGDGTGARSSLVATTERLLPRAMPTPDRCGPSASPAFQARTPERIFALEARGPLLGSHTADRQRGVAKDPSSVGGAGGHSERMTPTPQPPHAHGIVVIRKRDPASKSSRTMVKLNICAGPSPQFASLLCPPRASTTACDRPGEGAPREAGKKAEHQSSADGRDNAPAASESLRGRPALLPTGGSGGSTRAPDSAHTVALSRLERRRWPLPLSTLDRPASTPTHSLA